MVRKRFLIAQWVVEIAFCQENEKTGFGLLPSFTPFVMDGDNEDKPLFVMTIDDTLRPLPKDQRQRIKVFDTGNGDTVVDRLDDGGYQFIIRDIDNNDCCLLICNSDFTDCRCALTGDEFCRRFGLNNAMMLAFAFAGSLKDTLLVHASLVRHAGYGYAFVAKSGTGKSTQVSNWLRVIPDCDLMNDDNPVIRIIDGNPFVFGSPWSGKTPCYRQVSAPLAAITQIVRDKENRVERLSPIHSFGVLLPSCSAMKWEKDIYRHICDTVTTVVSHVPLYNLYCTADAESAIVCHESIAKN